MLNNLEVGHKKGKIEVRTVQLARPIPSGIRLLYISDLHFNRFSGRRAEQLADIISAQKPDLLLWGGDYADTNAGFAILRELLSSLSPRPHMVAVAGNHDHFFGIRKLTALMCDYGVQWIENASVQMSLREHTVRIDGNAVSKDTSSAMLRILCMHRPSFPSGAENQYDLALAGHLHGCQFVFWQQGSALFPGRWFYRWNVLEKQIGRCLFVVSRGVGDTLPLRFNCPREVVLVKS